MQCCESSIRYFCGSIDKQEKKTVLVELIGYKSDPNEQDNNQVDVIP